MHQPESPPDYSPASPEGTPTPFQPHPVDVIAPIFPLGDPLINPVGQDARHLPHLISSALSLSLSKPKASLCLAEALVFIRPPGNGWSNALAEVNRDDTVEGRDGKLNGFLNIVAPERKLAKGIKVELIGIQRLSFNGNWEDDKVFESRLELNGDGEGIWLEKGVNTFEFNFHIPSDSPVTDRCVYGRVQYQVQGTVFGMGGMFSKDLSDSREVIIVSSPSRQDGNIYQFQVHNESISPNFGPYRLSLSANQFIIAAPLFLSLTFASVQSTIYAINCYIQQTTRITSRRNPSKTEEIKGPKRYVFQEGAKGGYAQKGFAQRAKDAGDVLVDYEKDKGSFWEWKRVGRLPIDDLIRSTTLPATQTGLRFSSELCFEIVFTDPGDSIVKVATVFKQDVALASCCCMLPYLTLPSYSDNVPESKRIKWDVKSCIGCMCDEVWEQIRDAELKLMQNGQEGLVEEGIRATRQGGLINFEDVSPEEPPPVSHGRKVGESYPLDTVLLARCSTSGRCGSLTNILDSCPSPEL